MVNKIITGVTTLSLAAALLFGATQASAQTNNSTVRVVHASPDAPAVDIYVDDKKTLSSLSFKRVTGYLSLPAGKHNIKVYASTAKGAGAPVAQQDVDLNGGWDYTVAATGRASAVQLRVFSDNLNLPGKGKTNVRVYHLSPNAPAVNLAVKGGNVLARNLSYGNATDYLQLDTKSYQIEVQSATDSKALVTTTANLSANSVQSIFAFGLVGETPAFSTTATVDRRGGTTPATGAEDSFAFMTLVAAMIAGTGIALKKIAVIQERA
jgi:hypothetical protein